jgi:RNA polymerase sigma factor (sigma-70 family)
MDASEREQYRVAIHGDRDAFEMIIRMHSRSLFAIAYGILQSREEAEDVVQDSLVKAWKTRWRVRDPEKFPAWLATIARHRARDIFRKRRTVPLSATIDEIIESGSGAEPNGSELDQQLRSALAACRRFIVPRSHFVTSKRWITAPSKIPWASPMVRCVEFSAALSLRCVNSFARLSPQSIKRMATIHNEIDNWLAADIHGELSDVERSALHTHLVECAACRKSHQENKVMNRILEETLAQEKPDPAFEQRMLSGFRNRIPQRRSGFAGWIVDLMRLRAVQFTAVAAILVALVQMGRMITGENVTTLRDRERYAKNYVAAQLAEPPESRPSQAGALARSSQLAAGRPQDSALEQPPSSPETRSKSHEGGKATATTVAPAKPAQPDATEMEAFVASSEVEEAPQSPLEAPAAVSANRKLIRNATVELEIVSFDDAVQKITAFANEERGYVATTSSEKQANGKRKGEIVVKVLPENLDRFLQKVRSLGELKNQTLGTEDVTKAYFDTDARLKNAHVMEQRLIDMLKTKTGKVSDLLQVEKELARVREEVEKMQGELKYWDSLVQFATVTISLAEKDMEEPAAFLLKERAQLALYAPDVEKIYNDVKDLASPKVQITNAQLNRDYSGRVSARVSMLIAPEESDAMIGQVKGLGRVENFQVQTERVAQGGSGISENAKTKRDKVELNITISREEQEQAFQQTTLRIRTSSVDEKAKELGALAEKQSGRIRTSTFNRNPDGREVADVSLRVPMKNYSALMQSLNSLGKVENVSVQRQDRTGEQIDEANAPAHISIQVYSQGNIVSQERGLFATLRRTLAQSAGAIMWSLRMIGVAIAFLAPWTIAVVGAIWIIKRIKRARR